MDKEQLEREGRSGRIAGILGIVGVVIFILSNGIAVDFNSAEEAERLKLFDGDSGQVLTQAVLQALGYLLFIPPIYFLFRAAQARTNAVRPAFVGVIALSPLLLAISIIATYFAFDAAAKDFLDPAAGLDTSDNDVARDTFYNTFAGQARTGLGTAGALGVTFSVIYTSLYALRTGLMSRFWGTLGMALGVGSILLGSPILLVYFLAISLLLAAFWPGGRPPAWDAGVAMPWPKPGEEPVASVADEADQAAQPEDFEGSATEVPSPGRPGRRDNKRKRKRKAR